MNEKTVSALIGLCGAINNNGKTQNTDKVVMCALRNEDMDCYEAIIREKYTISPTCETCENPCSNTSDYDMSAFNEIPLKKDLLDEIVRYVSGLDENAFLSQLVYDSISYLGYDLTEDSYREMIGALREEERK